MKNQIDLSWIEEMAKRQSIDKLEFNIGDIKDDIDRTKRRALAEEESNNEDAELVARLDIQLDFLQEALSIHETELAKSYGRNLMDIVRRGV